MWVACQVRRGRKLNLAPIPPNEGSASWDLLSYALGRKPYSFGGLPSWASLP
jgi:hypothetical protein